ncbi:MAG TPA: peptide ABC transporter ATP-binding protein [Treponema sp.]|nr:peptide ABC transporter ATP-binding protein [Treponema sp.]
MALLEIRNLSVGIKRRGKCLRAVKEISFEIEAGEITALAGESGGGKTLTALSIPRLLPEAASILGGEIIFDSAPLHSLGENEMRKHRGKDIAMIFQEPQQALNPLMRIGTQIAETPLLHGERNKKQARRAALEIIDSMGFTDPEKIYGAYPHQLSLGMCQRIMIAIAAISRPKLLIADEPAASLDTATQTQILDILARMNKEFGTTILFISHDLPLIRRFCKRLIIMYGGKIFEDGPAEKICAKPAHPYTQGLIAAIPSKEQRGSPLPGIAGRSPSIEDFLPGCPFAPRCPRVLAQCRESFPPLTILGAGQRMYCYNPGGDSPSVTEAGNV